MTVDELKRLIDYGADAFAENMRMQFKGQLNPFVIVEHIHFILEDMDHYKCIITIQLRGKESKKEVLLVDSVVIHPKNDHDRALSMFYKRILGQIMLAGFRKHYEIMVDIRRNYRHDFFPKPSMYELPLTPKDLKRDDET